MAETNQDTLSPEDAQALIHTQQQLYAAGDPRAAKVYNFIVQGGYAKRGPQGELLPMDTMGAAPSFADRLKSTILHPLNSLESASQSVSRPSGATVPEMVGADLANVGAGAAGVIRHPLRTAAGMVTAPVQTVLHPADTFQQLNQGGPQLGAQMLGQGLATAGLTKAIAPSVPAAADAAADAGTALATKAQTVAAKIVPALADGPPESLVTRAVKPGKNNVGWNSDVKTAIPLMKSAEQAIGQPVSGIEDAVAAAKAAKQNIWQQVRARLGPAAEMGATIDGNHIADAMMGSIDKRMAMQNPGLVEQIKTAADTYRRPMTVDEAEDFIQSNNKELIGYYAKNKVSQAAAEADPTVAAKVAEGNALRDALYSKIDTLTGPGVAQLKKAYGALSNVQKELTGRQIVYARQAPVNLGEQLGYLQAAGKIATGNVYGGLKDIAIRRFLSNLNDTNSMIGRAFEKAQPAQPFPAPASPRFAGLLQRGPIQTPPPADSAAVPNYQPPPIDATTRAQRLGLLLPEKSGAPTILPYYPEMTAGEKIAALMQLIRQAHAPALPAKASAIQIPPR